MKKRFRLTYDTVTEESASYGDHATHGFVTRNLTIPARTHLPKNPAHFTLKEALSFCEKHGGTRQAEPYGMPPIGTVISHTTESSNIATP